MTGLWDYALKLAVLTLKDPRAAARQIIALNLPTTVLWHFILIVVILSVVLSYGTVLVAGQEALIIQIAGSPVVLTLFMAGEMVLLIFALFWAGKAMGGVGELASFAALLGWLQSLWIAAQVVQTLLLFAIPSASALLGIVAMGYGLWVLVQFISEAHGFESWLKGAGVLILSIFGVLAGISFLLSLIGFSALGLENYV